MENNMICEFVRLDLRKSIGKFVLNVALCVPFLSMHSVIVCRRSKRHKRLFCGSFLNEKKRKIVKSTSCVKQSTKNYR